MVNYFPLQNRVLLIAIFKPFVYIVCIMKVLLYWIVVYFILTSLPVLENIVVRISSHLDILNNWYVFMYN